MNDIFSFKNTVLSLGADHAEIISVESIPFAPSLRTLCESNQCGNYGKNWTCPPYVGEIDELIESLKKYKDAVIFQKVYKLEDSFDIEGMQDAMHNFRQLTDTISNTIKSDFTPFLILSAGGCVNCERCAVLDNLPCINPEHAYASLESYGIQVSELAKVCNLKYINGQNTVTYFGGIYLKEVYINSNLFK